MFKRRILRSLLRKCRKLKAGAIAYGYLSNSIADEEYSVPKDVPEGHLVVYVGDEHRRFVVQVAFLNHPLFRALLDRAQEVYGFNSDFKLRIPCDETMFVSVLRYIGSQQARKIWLCF